MFFANERFQGNLVPLTRTPINPTDDLGAIGTDGVRGAGWIGLKEQLAKVATYEILKALNGKVTGTIVYYLQIDGETTTTRVLEEMPVEINLREERPATAGLPSGASMSTPSAVEEAEEVTAEPVSSDNPDDCNCGPRMTDWSPWTQHEVAPSPFRLAQFTTPGADQGNALKDVTLAVRENARVIAELSERVNALSNTTFVRTGAATEPQSTAPAKVQAQPTVVNVQLSPVMPAAADCEDGCGHDHPLLQQMHTHSMECWRNLRDKIPCY